MHRIPIALDDRDEGRGLELRLATGVDSHGRNVGLFPRPASLPLTEAATSLQWLSETVFDLDTLVQQFLASASVFDQADVLRWFVPEVNLNDWHAIIDLTRSLCETAHMVNVSLREIGGLIVDSPTQDGALQATFFLEATEQYLVGAGHQLCNLAFRVCLTSGKDSATVRSTSAKWRTRSDASRPGSHAHCGWLMHSQARDLVAVIGKNSRSPGGRIALCAARLYRRASWRSVDDARGENFHRLRLPVTAQGADWQTPLMRRYDAALDAAQDLAVELRVAFSALTAASPRHRSNGLRLFGQPVDHLVVVTSASGEEPDFVSGGVSYEFVPGELMSVRNAPPVRRALRLPPSRAQSNLMR